MQKELLEILKARLDGCRKIALLGVGAELRGDDGAGMAVVHKLRELARKHPFVVLEFEAFEGSNAPENATCFINAFSPKQIVIVDAADMGLAVGATKEIPVEEISGADFSTHTLPMKVVTDYLTQTTGATITIIGMQPKALEFDTLLSDEMEAGVESFVSAFFSLLKDIDAKL